MKDKINMSIKNISNGYLYKDDQIAGLIIEKFFPTKDELIKYISQKLNSIGII